MLLRKMLRDMKANRAQFVSIFLMAMLGVFVYAGINAEWVGMRTEVDRYYAETSFPDFWAMGEGFTAGDAKKAASIPGVSAVQRRLTLDAAAKLEGDPTVRVGVLDENRLSAPYLVEGEPFDASKDGIWLDESFAKAHHLKVSDSLTLEVSGIEVAKPILGLVLHPEYVYAVKDDAAFTPDPRVFGFAFVPRTFLPMAGLLPYTELLIKKDGTVDAAAVKAALELSLSEKSSVILTRDTLVSAVQIENEIDQNKAMGGVFPVIFFLIAALTMLTTMTRLTSGQRIQIGTLKALGFKRRTILTHYVHYGLWLGLLGGMLGLAAGPAVIPPILFSMQRTIYSLPRWRAALSAWDAAGVAAAVIVCAGASYLACRRELGDAPAATLRPRSPKASRHTRLEKSGLWRRLGFSVQWNLRDILRSKVRSAMAVAGVVGCTALLLMSLGLRDSVNDVADWLYGDLNRYETRITLAEGIADAQLRALTAAYPGQLVQESAIELKAGATVKRGTLTVVTPGNGFRFENGEGHAVALPESGVAISGKMAELLGAKTGDVIAFRIYGEKDWHESAIGALYRTPITQGIAVSASAYQAMGAAFRPTALLLDGQAPDAVHLAGVKGVQSRAALKSSFTSILDSMQAIIAILILAAIVLAIVVLYNLGSLSFIEKSREMATLKVLGFPTSKIRGLLQRQNVWLTLTGIAIGIPLGFAFIGFMLSTISESSDFIAYVSPLTLAETVSATFSVSFIVNLSMSRRIRTLDMVGALKSIE